MSGNFGFTRWALNVRAVQYGIQLLARLSQKNPVVYLGHEIQHIQDHNKMADFSQTTFIDAFSWQKTFVFWFEFHWRLFLVVKLTISLHCFR